jgi:hypothetical protein
MWTLYRTREVRGVDGGVTLEWFTYSSWLKPVPPKQYPRGVVAVRDPQLDP